MQSVPTPEALRSNNYLLEITTVSALSEDREEEYSDGDNQQEEEDEDNFPCPHCGALMSFEYLYFPDTGLFSGTCTKCGGAPAPRTP